MSDLGWDLMSYPRLSDLIIGVTQNTYVAAAGKNGTSSGLGW